VGNELHPLGLKKKKEALKGISFGAASSYKRMFD
jgi:hypothetical protein